MNPLNVIIKFPAKLLAWFELCVDCRMRETAPVIPSKTPNAFFLVIGSFSIIAASIITKIGTAVAMIEASTGDVMLSPQINKPWLKPTPHKAHINKVPMSFNETFSKGTNSEVIQNITQAKDIRMIVKASGARWVGNKYLETGIFIANRMFATNISRCPFCFSEFMFLLL